MRKSDIFLILWLSFTLPAFADQKVEITTYYPSPNGVAKELLLPPTSTDPAPGHDQGIIYYNQSLGVLLCNGTDCPVWQGMGWSWLEYWRQNTTGIYPNTTTWQVSTVNGTTAVNGTLEIGGAFFRDRIWTDLRTAADLATQVNLGVYDESAGAWLYRSKTRNKYETVCGGHNFVNHDAYPAELGGTVVGGWVNIASGHVATIVGGGYNTCYNSAPGQVISGGCTNFASVDEAHSRSYTVVSGGEGNQAGGLIAGNYSVVSGGHNNTASGEFAVISSGENCTASGNYAVVNGGQNNTASGDFATVSGGEQNTASGKYSIVTSGFHNTASGDYSWAGGANAIANDGGSFVWNGVSGGGSASSHGLNTFTIAATNGIYFVGGPGASQTINGRSFDVAEYLDIPGNSSLLAGELASLSADRVVDRSGSAYDQRLLGVVSGKKTCSFFMGESKSPRPGYGRTPVSLAGPVYCRVNDQSGPVAIGDPITSSDTAGEGMKAKERGRIVGYAMQDEKFQDSRSKEILVFVSPGFHQKAEDFYRIEEQVSSLQKRIAQLEKDSGKAR